MPSREWWSSVRSFGKIVDQFAVDVHVFVGVAGPIVGDVLAFVFVASFEVRQFLLRRGCAPGVTSYSRFSSRAILPLPRFIRRSCF